MKEWFSRPRVSVCLLNCEVVLKASLLRVREAQGFLLKVLFILLLGSMFKDLAQGRSSSLISSRGAERDGKAEWVCFLHIESLRPSPPLEIE